METIGQIIAAVIVIGGGYVLSRIWLGMMEIHKTIKTLDAEIAADQRRRAEEERRAMALLVIATNQQQAERSEA